MTPSPRPGEARPVGRPRHDGRPHLSRDAVLQAAAKLIAREGFAGASVRRLGAALDAAPASLFNLFPSKDVLLDELIVYAAAPSLRFYAALQAIDAPAPARLYWTVHEEVSVVASIDPDYPALFYLPELRRPQFAAAQAARAEMVDHYRRLIDAGVAAGDFVCEAPALAAEQMLQLTETSVLAAGEAAAMPAADQARATARLCLRALLRDPDHLDAVEARAQAIDLHMSLPAPVDGPGG
ncbi:MAG: TetR/AcrR family transcriptional regulator [Phenylobacterium sp.]|uniref:TetR/AcrR family transcriptional regulator n=1 Tax=Phenylobacterium sp. TaxID=1871053 RepID=UPI00391B87CA